MRWLLRLRALFHNLVLRSEIDRDLRDELASYVELSADEARDRGLPADGAARHARLQLGGASAVTESVRASRAGAGLERFWQDVRYAVRGLWRTASYSVAAVVTLALSLGLATAVFSVAYGILVRPLPVGHADQVLAIYKTNVAMGRTRDSVSGARFEEWRGRNQVFAGMAALTGQSLFLSSRDVAVRVDGELVSSDFFQVLEVSARHGRVFSSSDGTTGSGPVPCVIAESLWRRVFASDPTIVGRSFEANGVAFTVTGVVSEAFSRWRQPAELWAPYALTPSLVSPATYRSDGYRILRVFGRLRREVTPDGATASMKLLDPQVQAIIAPNSGANSGVAVVSLRDAAMDSSVRRSLLFLSLITAIVLALAACNVASATLTRNAGRSREFGTRLALGGTTWRLTAQLMTEAAVLLVAGALLALVVAYAVVPALVALAPRDATRASIIAVVFPALLFTLAMAAAIVLPLAAVSGMRSRWRGLGLLLRPVGQTTPAPRTVIAHAVLVAVQAMVAVPVLVAAALLMVSVARLQAIDLGFDKHGLHVVRVDLPAAARRTPEAVTQLGLALAEGRSESQSIGPLAVSNGAPVLFFGERTQAMTGVSITIESGRAYANGSPKEAPFAPSLQRVTSGYFSVLGSPIRQGRDFGASDRAGAPSVAVVNQTMARMHWPGESPIGKRINFDIALWPGQPLAAPWTEIVGVVADARRFRIDAPARPEIYVPIAQTPFAVPWFFVHARGRGSDAATASALHDLIRSTDPRLSVGEVKTVPAMIDELTATPRYSAALLGVFSAIALVLAAVGVFGLGAFAVAQRRREIGIRLALGATPQGVVRFVVARGLVPAVVGLVAGAFIARAMDQLLRGLVFGVEPSDPVVFAGVMLMLLIVAAVAAYLPARRATRINPVETLRAE